MTCRRIAAVAVALGLVCVSDAGQPPPEGRKQKTKKPDTGPPPKPASLEGIVIAENNGRALRRAEVALKPATGDLHGYIAITDDSGQFSFPEVAPGNYSIAVQRDGYLTSSVARVSGTRLPLIFAVREGSRMNDITLRLQPSGVIAGKVKFDDGEPAVNVAVQLYREYFYRGLHGFTVGGLARTNDRGEYRIHGLAPGTFYVAAVYQRAALLPGAEEPLKKGPRGVPLPELRYAITFFPAATKMVDAVPVRLGRGQEVGVIDIFLNPVPTVRIRGNVISGLSGQIVRGPAVALRRADASDSASVNAPVDMGYDRENSVVLKGVVPGSYYFIVNASENGKQITARQLVTVGDAGIDNLNIVLTPVVKWKGAVSIEGAASYDLEALHIALEPRRETANRVTADVDEKGAFAIAFTPGETYDLMVEGGPPEAYLKSVRLSNFDVLSQGLKAEGGADPYPIQVVLGTDAGKVVGRVVTPENTVASGAAVMLIPDPPRGRVQFYKTVYADEAGLFYAQGVAPGRYAAIAWLDEPPCEVYDPEAIGVCRAAGTVVEVTALGQTTVELKTAP